ncbi:hypothetical protein [Devosia nitrariae]|uniref:AAA domain-containing protein n=1 Tax=Devosia nitrariae TaxID=2071872 RepID=A0ABQ5W0P0_9HYPH|nr:hypothetical protein [Devosia nitrariae]GLQ53578.1 hypothetical protein GCM10010862_08370 [Devosia nitrariae]
MEFPRLIGICGHPGSGKSEVQRILQSAFGYEPADDGWPLRDIAIRHFGLSLDDVTTQAGKCRWTSVTGSRMQHRDILGRLGNALEHAFGHQIMPWLACQSLDPGRRYSFGSVRRDQGKVYKALGGAVIGVRRLGVGPSEFEFDRFSEEIVDVWIENDGGLNHLSQKTT